MGKSKAPGVRKTPGGVLYWHRKGATFEYAKAFRKKVEEYERNASSASSSGGSSGVPEPASGSKGSGKTNEKGKGKKGSGAGGKAGRDHSEKGKGNDKGKSKFHNNGLCTTRSQANRALNTRPVTLFGRVVSWKWTVAPTSYVGNFAGRNALKKRESKAQTQARQAVTK